MKLKNYWKRFWTLDRHHAAGFTLVELIVVIAILAILAGVGIPVYSGYITKANKQADMTLASEVANALMLYHYSNPNKDTSGYVVLTMDRASGDGTVGDAAMQAVFGDNWARVATLKYDGWIDSAIMLNQVANNAYAASVNDSSYISNVGTDVLLGDVQNCTSSLAKFLSSVWSGKEGATELDSLLGGNTAVSTMLNGYEDKDITADVLANATVFGIASTMKDATSSEAIINSFGNIDGGFVANASNLTTSSLNDIAHTYAALEALVGYLDNEEATAAFNALNETGFNSTNPNTILKNIQDTCSVVYEAGGMDTLTYYGLTIGEEGPMPDPNITKSQAQMDGEAYVAIMQTVNNLGNDYTDSLSNSELFSGAEMSNRVNNYVSAATLIGSLDENSTDILNQIANGSYSGSSIVISFSINTAGEPVCVILPAEATP